MEKPISVGDLVVVVKACCAKQDKWLGKTFIAAAYHPRTDGHTACCGSYKAAPYFTDESSDGGWSQWFLKRIPPLLELEGEKRDEKLTEPA